MKWAVAAACLVIAVAVGVPFAGDRTASGIDATITGWIDQVLGGRAALLRLMVLPTEPVVLLPLLAIVVGACVLGRRWDGVALAVLGVAVPVALNTWVLKPLFDRMKSGYLAYPSGHTVSMVATLTVLVLLARPGTAKTVTAALSTAILVIAGTGLVGSGYHYPTDVLGGACFAVAVVLALSSPTRRLAPAPSDGSPPAGTSSGSPPASSRR
ncbi:phosphatase PAP2 family protein [Amycolatopsis endophytica]|uniref:Membrane-associated phospholipid phosphatase n=1 Tax=Amycolatopsis endophytica TaxID=860233 RepID=A0A853B7I5_9PSEU|nr:phosphatase PAP2 family protein [Amycolatopsis endophytica]NYI90671.1 membrane-associated phospholipid phosphatase [Amycolatopsis endophytica]